VAVSRRSFVGTLVAGGAGLLTAPLLGARGLEAARFDQLAPRRSSGIVRLDSNENPNGPGSLVLDAMRGAFGEANRYPDRPMDELTAAVARAHGVSEECVAIGCGSTDVLRMAVIAFTSSTRALVTASPTYEDPGHMAEAMGAEVRAVRVTSSLSLDLDAMLGQASGAGLVFLCNPNNPTSTVHGFEAIRSFVHRARALSPAPVVLVDEAYHEYVDDPSYATAIPLALEAPGVIVSRTFSKVYGLAGMRVGYAVAHAETMKAMRRFALGSAVNVLAATAALVTLADAEHLAREQAMNREAREYTRQALRAMGYTCTPSNTNFVMVEIGRDAKTFQKACRERGVAVGRAFPPLDTHARISIGTMDEMRQAMTVVREALA
jgi:histidinol-phosphate aminotransferase